MLVNMAVDMKAVLANLLTTLSRNGTPSNITELKTVLTTARSESVYLAAKDLDLTPLFGSLETQQGDDLENLIGILGKLLDAFPPRALVSAYKAQITRALSHPSSAVKGVVLRQLIRCSKDNSTLCEIAWDRHLLEPVVKLLGDEDPWTSKQSATILKEVTREKEALSALLHPPLTSVMDQVMARGDIYRFRVHEILVGIAKASPENLEQVADSGRLQGLLNEINGSDILVKLNALELLTELATTVHGLDYLEKVGLLSRLRDKVVAINVDPLASFLAPGLLKFFGSIGLTNPQRLVANYPQVLGFIFDCVEDGDLSCQSVSIETIGVIGSTLHGKRALRQFGNKMKNYMKILRHTIQAGRDELRVRALAALANVLHMEETAEDVLTLTEQWYGDMGDASTKMLLQICRQPFQDLRCGALTVVREMAHLPWGQATLSAHPGFLEYLLDRSTEPDREGKEAKYAIVAAFAESHQPPRGISLDEYECILGYYKEGPFYSEAVTAVAFEGAT